MLDTYGIQPYLYIVVQYFLKEEVRKQEVDKEEVDSTRL